MASAKIDAVVVGGGPAGSTCALLLARAGLAVTLVERANFPRRKVCGEYLNSGAVAALDRIGVLGDVRAQAFGLHGVRLIPPRAPAVELPFAHGALACERETLDALLLRAAVYAGVTVVHGRVEDLLRDRGRIDGVWVRNDDGSAYEVRARWTVGADGCGSLVARRAGLTRRAWRTPRFAVGGHYAGFGDLGGFIEMYVGAGAYFALNPLSQTTTNVMVVVPKTALAKWSGFVDEGVAGKAAELGRGHRSFAGAHRIGARAAAGPLAHSVRAPVARGLVLIGDAAGFLNPFTGQGVFLALTSAEAAAHAIVTSAGNIARETTAFATYAGERGADFAARKRLSAAIGWMIDVAPLARRAAARLARRPTLADALVDALAGMRAPQSALSANVLGKLIL
ncbi:MAG TPA: NAD(P)/FAD-dependent oxidoreductase [Candidatus Lustribacter sp.]|nr:NAD(P)/FAD-dependent oxidoreductase [Candidatus Lustribacter sp.]